MVTEGFSPNLATYGYKMLVNAYSKGKRKDEAWRLIEELVQKGMMPDSVRKKNVLRLKSLDQAMKAVLLSGNPLNPYTCDFCPSSSINQLYNRFFVCVFSNLDFSKNLWIPIFKRFMNLIVKFNLGILNFSVKIGNSRFIWIFFLKKNYIVSCFQETNKNKYRYR